MRCVALRIALLGGAAAAACGEVLGVGDYRVDTGHGGEKSTHDPAAPDGATGPDAAATCDGCLETECAAELASCQANPTCVAALKCDLACGPDDLDCASLCAGRYAQSERGIEPYALLACRAAHCTAPCGMPCNGVCLGNLGCDQCLARECGAAACDLLGATDGPARLACAVSTSGIEGGPDLGECSTSLPGPETEWKTWDSCRSNICSDACTLQTLTPDFRCLGQTGRIAAARDLSVLDFEVRVIDLGFKAVAGVEVRFCQGVSPCAPEQEPPVTNDRGVATLSASRALGGTFFEYLEIKDPSGVIDDTLIVITPPLVHAIRLTALTLSKKVLDGYYSTGGVAFERWRFGHVTLLPTSCGAASGSAGLYFESELNGTTYYIDTSFNSRFDLTETTWAAIGGFRGVEPGPGRFVVKERSTGRTISSVTAPVRAGAVTMIYAAPGEW